MTKTRFYPRSLLQGATKPPDEAKKPHIPTISRMKKPPVSRGPARELGGCRGTYPPPAAGCMVTALRWTKRAAGKGMRPRLRLSMVSI